MRQAIIQEWLDLSPESRQSEEQAVNFVTRAARRHRFDPERDLFNFDPERDLFNFIMRWLDPYIPQRVGSLDAAAFSQMVEAERERLMSEYIVSPVALKRRLGIAMGVDAAEATPGVAGPAALWGKPTPHVSLSGNVIGDLAIKTAVRATIWESLWALFRWIR